MNNNKGSTMLEHLIATMIFAVMALMICASFMAGSDLTYKAGASYNDRGTIYNSIERGDIDVAQSGTISFSLNGSVPSNANGSTLTDFDISGHYNYSATADVGEFLG